MKLRFWICFLFTVLLPMDHHLVNALIFLKHGSPAFTSKTSFFNWKLPMLQQDERWHQADSCIPEIKKTKGYCEITECYHQHKWQDTSIQLMKRQITGCLWEGICMQKGIRTMLPCNKKCYDVKCFSFSRRAMKLHENKNACYSEHGCYKPGPNMITLEASGLKCKCGRHPGSNKVMWTECERL